MLPTDTKAQLESGWFKLAREFPPALAALRVSAAAHCVVWALFNDSYNSERPSKVSSLTRIALGKMLPHYSRDAVTDALAQLQTARVVWKDEDSGCYAINTVVGEWQTVDSAHQVNRRRVGRVLARTQPAQSAEKTPRDSSPEHHETPESSQEVRSFPAQSAEFSRTKCGENPARLAGHRDGEGDTPPEVPRKHDQNVRPRSSAGPPPLQNTDPTARHPNQTPKAPNPTPSEPGGGGGGAPPRLLASARKPSSASHRDSDGAKRPQSAPFQAEPARPKADPDPFRWTIRAGIGELGAIVGYENAVPPMAALAGAGRDSDGWLSGAHVAAAVEALCVAIRDSGGGWGRVQDPAGFLIARYRRTSQEDAVCCETWRRWDKDKSVLDMPPEHASGVRDWLAERQRLRIERERLARERETAAAHEAAQAARAEQALIFAELKKNVAEATDAELVEFAKLRNDERVQSGAGVAIRLDHLQAWLALGRPTDGFKHSHNVTAHLGHYNLLQLGQLRDRAAERAKERERKADELQAQDKARAASRLAQLHARAAGTPNLLGKTVA